MMRAGAVITAALAAFALAHGSAHAQSAPQADPALTAALREGLSLPESYAELGRLAEAGNVGARALHAGFTALGMGGHGRPADFALACREWETAAGVSAEAAHFTAECYEQGLGGTTDIERAVTLYRLAGEGGYPKSLCALGNLYAAGRGVTTDPARAVALCRQGAELGDADAQTDLGNFYLTGRGAPRDYAEAARWYRRAADQNQANAAMTLGQMYWNGDGVENDRAQAEHWWRVAHAAGREDAAMQLGDAALARATRESGRLDIDALREAEAWYAMAERDVDDPGMKAQATERLVPIRQLLSRYGDRAE
jgi:TPR repeat protein